MNEEYDGVKWDGNNFEYPIVKDGEEAHYTIPRDGIFPQDKELEEIQPSAYQKSEAVTGQSLPAFKSRGTLEYVSSVFPNRGKIEIQPPNLMNDFIRSGGNLYSALQNIAKECDPCELERVFGDEIVKILARLAEKKAEDQNKTQRPEDIVVCDGETYYRKRYEDGRSVLVEIFNGYIKDVEKAECYGEKYFRLICMVEGRKSVGRYFPESFLENNNRFQMALFKQLTMHEKRASDIFALDFMRSLATEMYERNTTKVLSGHLGWDDFEMKYQREFPAGIGVASSPLISGLRFIPDEKVPEHSEVLPNTVAAYRSLGVSGSILFLVSYAAMLSSLFGAKRNDVVVVLQGDSYRCSQVATHFMRTYRGVSGNDVVVLSQVKKRDFDAFMKVQGDDVVVLNMDGRTADNKIDEIMTCAKIGTFAGVYTPIIFTLCTDTYLPFDIPNCLLLSIEQTKDVVFDQYPHQFRSAVIRTIEEKGTYWKERAVQILQEEVRHASTELSFITKVKALKRLLTELLCSSGQRIPDIDQFVKFLDEGIAGIEKLLLESNSGDSVIHFKDIIGQAVISGNLKVADRHQDCRGVDVMNCIFFDKGYYFFSNLVFDSFICGKNRIKGTALLRLKQHLYQQGYLRTYGFTNSKREFGIDFFFNRYGQYESLSGYAIKRDFWDGSTGGCSLIELAGMKEQKVR